MKDKISIIVPCYNQAHFLNAAVNSIIQQTHTNWECIIINDGSTDNTEKCAMKLVEKDSRIIYHKKNNGGLSSARNAGLNIATGDFIQFLDSDDYLEKTKLEKSIRQITSDIDAKIVISNFKMFQHSVSQSSKPYCDLKLEYFNFKSILINWDYLFTIPIHCGFFSSSVFKELRFNEQLKAKEDWLMWLTAFKNNKAIFINEQLAFYRFHSESMTQQSQLMIDNQLKAYKEIKNIILQVDYEEFVFEKIKQLLNKNNSHKKEIAKIKASLFYKLESKIKSIVNKIKRKL
jgi:glycosyltransferase involved in cell wall biosynthesis